MLNTRGRAALAALVTSMFAPMSVQPDFIWASPEAAERLVYITPKQRRRFRARTERNKNYVRCRRSGHARKADRAFKLRKHCERRG